MGTKSHPSKALPAPITSRSIGPLLFDWAAFRGGRVRLGLPARFLYPSVTKTPPDRAPLARTGAEICGLFRQQPLVAPLSYSTSQVLKPAARLSSASKRLLLCSLSLSSSGCLFFFTPSLYSLSFLRCFSTGLITARVLAVTHSSVTNKCFLLRRMGLKALCIFIYRSEVDLHLRSLCQIYGVSTDSLGTHTHVCVCAGCCNLSVCCVF